MMVWKQQFHSNTVIIGIHLKFQDLKNCCFNWKEAGKQARTWCKNSFESFLIYDSLESLGFGSKELKERQNSSDMVRPEKTKKKRTPTYDQNF